MKSVGLRLVDRLTQCYLALVILMILGGHHERVAHWGLFVSVHLAAILGISWMGRHGRSVGMVRWFRDFYPMVLFAAMYWETTMLNRLFFLELLDPPMARWEFSLFGEQPALSLMARFPSRWIAEVFYFSYFSYYLMIFGTGLWLYRRGFREFLHYLSVLTFVFYLCYLLYIIFPIAGPPAFPQMEPASAQAAGVTAQAMTVPPSVAKSIFYSLMTWIYRGFEGPGAAMPSSHVAIAWTTLFFAFRGRSDCRWGHAVLVVLLSVSTVYCRYHYVVDVAGGLLAAAIFLPLGEFCWRRWGEGNEPGIALGGMDS
jgi:membrane-associated phospholipid phosphatase